MRMPEREWMPEEYDPDDPLGERLKVIVDISGGIELRASDGSQTVTIGSPKMSDELSNGSYRLYTGNYNSGTGMWSWEVVVPDSGEPYLDSADPDQNVEGYFDSRETRLEGVDVRIHGVDADRL